MSRLHPAAHGFDLAAADYERARPGYPPEAVTWLCDALRLGPGRRVVDVGAGTGKLTRELVATGASVVAVEPSAPMRAELVAAVPDAEVHAATAEGLPLPDATLDAVTAAQSFHWFDAPRALPELHRVLRPDGHLGVVFNRRDLRAPEQAALDELLAPDRGDTPSWASDAWEAMLTGSRWFAPARLHLVPHRQQLDAAGLRARVLSISFVAPLTGPRRERVLRGLDELVARFATDGRVTLTYLTEVRVAKRRSR